MPSASKDDLLKRKQDLLRQAKARLRRDERALDARRDGAERGVAPDEAVAGGGDRPLEAAGVIDYYEQPEETQTIVRNNDLKNLSKRVDRIQGEIDSVDAELEQIEAMREEADPGGRHRDDQHQTVDGAARRPEARAQRVLLRVPERPEDLRRHEPPQGL